MKTIMIFITTMSMMYTKLNHPLSMGFTLIVITFLIGIMMTYMIKSAWYSYILFLIMLGGMLILFMYMASIASNEKMMFSNKMMLFTIVIMMTLSMIYKKQNFMKWENMLVKNSESIQMMKMYLSNTMMVTIFLSIYLLICMITVIYIMKINEGPIRKKS